MRIAILTDPRKREEPRITSVITALQRTFAVVKPENAELLIVIGGDGFMTAMTKEYLTFQLPFYGINRGTVGFLLNDHLESDDFATAITQAEFTTFPMLRAEIHTADEIILATAFNDIYTKTTVAQAAKHLIAVNSESITPDGPYIGDGIIVCTPGGSTAYSRAAGGIIMDHHATSLGLTPLAPFSPVGFSPVLLPGDSIVTIEMIEDDKRHHLVVADNTAYSHVLKVVIRKSNLAVKIGFKSDNSYFNKTKHVRFPWLKEV